MPSKVPSSTTIYQRNDRMETFAQEDGARQILELATSWEETQEDNHEIKNSPRIHEIEHLYLEWDPSAWSEFQDDAYATALRALKSSPNLKSLKIDIAGPARFTEDDYMLVTPESRLPRDLLKMNMPELCSTSPLSYSKSLLERPSIDLKRHGAVFHRSRKASVTALLALRNIPALLITGPMEISLRRKIYAAITADSTTAAHRLGAGLEPNELAAETNAIQAWEREMMTTRLGEDVVRICTMETVDDDEENYEDERVRKRMYGARKAGLTMAPRQLSEKDREWVLPTSKTTKVVIGWRAAGKVAAWEGPDQ